MITILKTNYNHNQVYIGDELITATISSIDVVFNCEWIKECKMTILTDKPLKHKELIKEIEWRIKHIGNQLIEKHK